MEMSFSKIDWNQEASSREKIYFVVVLGLVVVMFMRLLWFPTFANIDKKKQEIKNLRLQISTLEKFIDLDKKLVHKKTDSTGKPVDVEVERILKETAGDPQRVIADVIKEITSRKKLGNLSLNNISFQPIVAKGGYANVPVSITVEGTYSSIQNYLTKLEKVKYLFTVDNVKFENSEKRPGIIIADLTANLYLGVHLGIPPG